jgi:uncharacterized protein YcnI
MKCLELIGLLVLTSLFTAAQAHVVLENPKAPVGSFYKAVFMVPHGCSGSDTTKIRVHTPKGVIAVKPRPKPGWKLTIKRDENAKARTFHGETLETDVREVDWAGDLPDAYFDEFEMVVYLTPALKAGQTLYFPVVQQCKQGVSRWTDTSGDPAAAHPAPHVKLLPKKDQ